MVSSLVYFNFGVSVDAAFVAPFFGDRALAQTRQRRRPGKTCYCDWKGMHTHLTHSLQLAAASRCQLPLDLIAL